MKRNSNIGSGLNGLALFIGLPSLALSGNDGLAGMIGLIIAGMFLILGTHWEKVESTWNRVLRH